MCVVQALGVRIAGHISVKLREIESRNVIGQVEGTDSTLRSQAVLFTAHWDHLGVGAPDAKGDKIYNGAIDNGTGTAALIELG